MSFRGSALLRAFFAASSASREEQIAWMSTASMVRGVIRRREGKEYRSSDRLRRTEIQAVNVLYRTRQGLRRGKAPRRQYPPYTNKYKGRDTRATNSSSGGHSKESVTSTDVR